MKFSDEHLDRRNVELAEAYSDLLKQLGSSSTVVHEPRLLKSVILDFQGQSLEFDNVFPNLCKPKPLNPKPG